MTDLPSEIFKIYGSFAIIFAFLITLIIWGIAHLTASPGTEVSVLWGFVKYTKSNRKLKPPKVPQSDKANMIILTLIENGTGQFMLIRNPKMVTIMAGKGFWGEPNKLISAEWEFAVKELLDLKFIIRDKEMEKSLTPQDNSITEMYQITSLGRKYAEELKKR